MVRSVPAAADRWSDIFPTGEHKWTLGVRRVEIGEFFAPTAERETVLAERARWLDDDPIRYAQLLPEAAPAVDETAALLDVSTGDGAPYDRLLELGRRCEHDLVWLTPGGAAGRWMVVGHAVCFPSRWSPAEKLGRTLEAVHGPVPLLNAALGPRIAAFLAGFADGYGWRRLNWSVAADAERNHHPDVPRAQLSAATPPERTFLRLEHQLLARLSRSQTLLFALRIEVVPVTVVAAEAAVAARFARLLETMADDVARYKNLAEVRAPLIAYLGGAESAAARASDRG